MTLFLLAGNCSRDHQLMNIKGTSNVAVFMVLHFYVWNEMYLSYSKKLVALRNPKYETRQCTALFKTLIRCFFKSAFAIFLDRSLGTNTPFNSSVY